MGNIHLAGKFSCFGKKWKKEITLDQSKSLENVKVGKKAEQQEIIKKQSRGTH